jgi:hypothetical protein
LSDNDGEKLYREADERESFGVEALIPTSRLCALLGHLGITSAPRYRSRESCVQGGWNSRQLQRSSPDLGSSAGTRGQPSEHLSVMLWLMPPGRPSLLRAVSTRMNCRTPSTASCLSERRTNSRPLGEERCPQDGDGAPPGRDGGAEHPPAGCSVRDQVSVYPAVELRRHHLRVLEDGRGPG